jgi:hypothetical protein
MGLIFPIMGDMSSAPGEIYRGDTNGVAMPQIEWREKMSKRKFVERKFVERKNERENFRDGNFGREKSGQKKISTRNFKNEKRKTKNWILGKPENQNQPRRSPGGQLERGPCPKNRSKNTHDWPAVFRRSASQIITPLSG